MLDPGWEGGSVAAKPVSRRGTRAQWRKRRVGRTEEVALTYIHDQGQNRELVGNCCRAQGAQLRAL